MSNGVVFFPLLPSPFPAYSVPDLFPWSPVPCWLGCWIFPSPLRWNRKEVTAGRTSFPPVVIRFESCALTKSFPQERRPWLWKRLWACFTVVLPLPLPKRGGFFWILMVRRNSWSGKPTKTVSLLRLQTPGISYSHTRSYATSRNLSKLPVKCSYCIFLWDRCLLLQVNRSRLLNLRTHLSPQIWGGSLPCNFRSLMNPRKGIHFKFHAFEVCPAFVVLGQEWWLSSSVLARTEPDNSPARF